jgi:hypothetical protein
MSEERKIKIALIRLVYKDRDCGEYETSEWVKDHMTEFSEVSQEQYGALRQFCTDYNYKHKKDQRYIIIEDETHLLPKTICEALVYAEKKKEEWRIKEAKLEKERKAREKLKKQTKLDKLEKQIADLEKMKKKMENLKGVKHEKETAGRAIL